MRFSTSCYLGSLVFGVTASSDTTQSICDIVSSALSKDVFFPDSDTYNASIASYPFIQLRLHPSCLIRPQSAQDVSTAVKALKKSKGTKFAVKGGGHNANAGFNNIEDGVTIDMQSLNAVEISRDIVRVGGGAIWQNVYDALEPYNISVLGGRIGVVGVPGFLTGGGISFFSPERGWACDGVVNFQVVLANGDIVDANATSRPDLFAALKGGQINFGIVTRFDLQSFPAGPLWGGRINFAPEAEAALVDGFTKFKDPNKYDPYAAGWTTFSYNGSSKLVTPNTILWYTKPEQQPGTLAYLTEVKPQAMNGMQVASIANFTRTGSRAVKGTNNRTIWATTSFRISPTIVGRIHALWKSLIPDICDTYAYATPSSDLTFQAIPPPPRSDSKPNSLGFAPNSSPEKDVVFLQIVFHFNDGNATTGLNNALKEFVQKFDALAKDEGVDVKWRYLNFAAWFQDPLASYGDKQLKQLKRVARKYDPEGFFQKQIASGFKVSEAYQPHGYGADWHGKPHTY